VSSTSAAGIFLCYRRGDTAPHARFLQYRLGERFSAAQVFMDLDSIEAGVDFVEVIRQALDACVVLVALIGRHWLTLTDEGGRLRLNDPDDFVRFEIQTALARGVRVIPVLVDGAKPVRKDQLPIEMQQLARLHALELSHERYGHDSDRLIRLIQQVVDDSVSATIPVDDAAMREPGEALTPQAPRSAPTQATRYSTSSSSGAGIKLLYPAHKGTFFTTDVVALADGFDVIANVEIGRRLNMIVDKHILRVSIINLTTNAQVGLAQIDENLVPADAPFLAELRVEFGPLQNTSPGDMLNAVASYQVKAGVNTDVSSAQSATFIVGS
jgi:hypothetical protein